MRIFATGHGDSQSYQLSTAYKTVWCEHRFPVNNLLCDIEYKFIQNLPVYLADVPFESTRSHF